MERTYAGADFPEADDADHDGIIYYRKDTGGYLTPMTMEEYNAFVNERFPADRLIPLEYYSTTPEFISAVLPY